MHPILKTQWERLHPPVGLNQDVAETLLRQCAINAPLVAIEWLGTGCANTNYKLTFASAKPLVLRIYQREHHSLAREIAIYRRLAGIIPAPTLLHSSNDGEVIKQPWALLEWIDGKLMRDVLMGGDDAVAGECAFSAGQALTRLRHIGFSQGGFFEQGLCVRPFSPAETYYPFAMARLHRPPVQEALGAAWVERIHQVLQESRSWLPAVNPANLTHADFDPSNILVEQHRGVWRVKAVLDWEFALASSYLLDVGLFLRYDYGLPTTYRQRFAEGLRSDGSPLPSHWLASAKLMDLLCLLQLLSDNPVHLRPNLHLDVGALIRRTIRSWPP